MSYGRTYAHVLARMITEVVYPAFESKPRPEQVAALDKFGENIRALIEANPKLKRLLSRRVPRDDNGRSHRQMRREDQ
jgi:hypothetical protein